MVSCAYKKECKGKTKDKLVNCGGCDNNIHLTCYTLHFGEDDVRKAGDGAYCSKRCARRLKAKSTANIEERCTIFVQNGNAENELHNPNVEKGDRNGNAENGLHNPNVEKGDRNIKRRVLWKNDGADGINSESLLISWLANLVNYARWKGGDRHSGASKGAIASEIVQMFQTSGITQKRTNKDVLTKIASIEKQFRCAVDWLHATGSGVTDEVNLKSAVCKRCPYFYELKTSFGDRPSAYREVTEDDVQLPASNYDYPAIFSDSYSSDKIKEPNAEKNVSMCRKAHTPLSSKESSLKAKNEAGRIKKRTKRLKGALDVDEEKYSICELKREQNVYEREFRVQQIQSKNREVAAREAEVKARLDEVKVRQMEANASARLAEASVKKIEEETRIARIIATCLLLMKRKELENVGYSPEKIDAVLNI